MEDYQQIILPLIFSNVTRSQTFNVMIFEDAVPEGIEELNVTLALDSSSMGIVSERVTVSPSVATVRIRDNDRKFDCFS